MLTLCESDHLSNELYAVEFRNGKFNSMLTNGSSTDGQQHCLDATGTRPPEMRNVTFDDGADVQCTPSIAAYFCIIHDNQTRKMKNVEHLFRAIGPILIKLESLVLDTSTGELDNMHLYYDFWQHQLFELLIRYFELLTWDFGHFCETRFVLPISFNACNSLEQRQSCWILFFNFVLFVFCLPFACFISFLAVWLLMYGSLWIVLSTDAFAPSINRLHVHHLRCCCCYYCCNGMCMSCAWDVCATTRNQFILIDWLREIWMISSKYCNQIGHYFASLHRYRRHRLFYSQPALKFTIPLCRW